MDRAGHVSRFPVNAAVLRWERRCRREMPPPARATTTGRGSRKEIGSMAHMLMARQAVTRCSLTFAQKVMRPPSVLRQQLFPELFAGQVKPQGSGRVGSGATRKILRPPDPTRPNPRDLKSSPPDLTWPVRFQAPPDPTRSDPPDSDLTSEIRVRRGSGHLDLLGFFSRSAGSTQRIRPVGGRFKTK